MYSWNVFFFCHSVEWWLLEHIQHRSRSMLRYVYRDAFYLHNDFSHCWFLTTRWAFSPLCSDPRPYRIMWSFVLWLLTGWKPLPYKHTLYLWGWRQQMGSVCLWIVFMWGVRRVCLPGVVSVLQERTSGIINVPVGSHFVPLTKTTEAPLLTSICFFTGVTPKR